MSCPRSYFNGRLVLCFIPILIHSSRDAAFCNFTFLSCLLDASQLEKAGVVGQQVSLGLVQNLNDLLQNLSGLGLELVLGRAEDLLEDADQLRSELLDGRVGLLVEVVDALVDGGVLLIVLLEGKDVDNGGQSLGNEAIVGVLGDHAGDGTSDVVGHTHLVDGQERLKLLPEEGVQRESLASVGRVQHNQADSIGGVGLGQSIGVGETADKSLTKGLGERSHTLADILSNLGNGADSGRAVQILSRAGQLENGLLKDLPVLSEASAQGGGKTNNDIEGGVNDEPVVLGRSSIDILLLLLVAEILLAGVRSSDDEVGDGDDLVEQGLVVTENGGTAGLEGSSNVAVDVGDNRAIQLLAYASSSVNARISV